MEEYPEREEHDEIYIAPRVDDEDLKLLIGCIVDSDDRAASDISELLSDLQVQNARLGRIGEARNVELSGGTDRTNIQYYAVDAVMIDARASRLLLYARRQDTEYFELDFPALVKTSSSIATRKLGVGPILEKRFQRNAEKWLMPRDT